MSTTSRVSKLTERKTKHMTFNLPKAFAVLTIILSMQIAVADTENKKQDKNNAGSSPKADQMKPAIMFRVDGEDVSVERYASFLQANQQLVKGAITSDEGKAAVVREIAANIVIRKQMMKEGLINEGMLGNANEINKAYEEFSKKHFPRPSAPNEDQIFSYYKSHPSTYGIPRTVRLNEILIKFAKTADATVKDAARKKAEGLLKEIKSGKDFSALAEEKSENKISKFTRGDIGFQSVSDHAWLAKALESIGSGQVTEVTETPEGFAILQVTDERPAMIAPYANVRAKVLKDLLDDEQKKLRSNYVRDASKGMEWEVYESTLKSTLAGVLFP